MQLYFDRTTGVIDYLVIVSIELYGNLPNNYSSRPLYKPCDTYKCIYVQTILCNNLFASNAHSNCG